MNEAIRRRGKGVHTYPFIDTGKFIYTYTIQNIHPHLHALRSVPDLRLALTGDDLRGGGGDCAQFGVSVMYVGKCRILRAKSNKREGSEREIEREKQGERERKKDQPEQQARKGASLRDQS